MDYTKFQFGSKKHHKNKSVHWLINNTVPTNFAKCTWRLLNLKISKLLWGGGLWKNYKHEEITFENSNQSFQHLGSIIKIFSAVRWKVKGVKPFPVFLIIFFYNCKKRFHYPEIVFWSMNCYFVCYFIAAFSLWNGSWKLRYDCCFFFFFFIPLK